MGKAENHWVKTTFKVDPAAVAELAKRLPHQADAFLEMWLVAATGALLELPQTKDSTSRFNFCVALGGNLLWAASSLVAPEMKAVIIACSFVGATIGSGTFQQSDASPLKDINTHLHAGRDQASKKVHAAAGAIATKIVQQGKHGTEEQDEAIWAYLFGGMAYNSSSGLLERARAGVSKAWSVFEEQYESWLQVTLNQAETLNERMPPPKVDPFLLAKVGYEPALRERLDRDILPAVRKKHPFKIKLF